jgi:hypothetical protein
MFIQCPRCAPLSQHLRLQLPVRACQGCGPPEECQLLSLSPTTESGQGHVLSGFSCLSNALAADDALLCKFCLGKLGRKRGCLCSKDCNSQFDARKVVLRRTSHPSNKDKPSNQSNSRLTCQPSHSLSEPTELGIQNHQDGSPRTESGA